MSRAKGKKMRSSSRSTCGCVCANHGASRRTFASASVARAISASWPMATSSGPCEAGESSAALHSPGSCHSMSTLSPWRVGTASERATSSAAPPLSLVRPPPVRPSRAKSACPAN
eukprot:Amastigsp_a183801_4.p5 type:complete len:115 gc:universal Amastigsp_a183801_4:1238-894(-)